MKTKLTLLAAALIVGISSTSAFAGRDWNYFPVAPSKSRASAKPVFKSCCETKTRYTSNGIKNGIVVNKSIECNTGCAAPHAGKNCNSTERKQCAN